MRVSRGTTPSRGSTRWTGSVGDLPSLGDGKSPTEPVQRVDPRDGVVPLLTRMRATYRHTDISVSRSTEPVHSPPPGASVPGPAGQQSGDEHRLADPGGEVDGVEHGEADARRRAEVQVALVPGGRDDQPELLRAPTTAPRRS